MEYFQKPSHTNRLNKLQGKLDSPNQSVGLKDRKKLHSKDYEISPDWDDNKEENLHDYITNIPKHKMSLFAKIFVVAFVFFIASLGYAFYVFNGGPVKEGGADVEIEVLGPVSVSSSQPLTVDVIVQNNNSVKLETVDLIFNYPEGTRDHEDLSKTLTVVRRGIDDINGRSAIKETQTASLFGEEGVEKEIEITVEYRIEGSSAIFQKKTIFKIVIQSSPISLTVETDQEVTAGQEMEFEIELISNSPKTLHDVVLIGEYPFGFKASSADPAPTSGSNAWYFETLNPNETKTIKLVGKVEAQDGEERVFKFSTGLAEAETEDRLDVIFTTHVVSIDISRSFLAVDMNFDKELGDSFIRYGETGIVAEIPYTNNLDDPIQDARIEVEIVGDVLDEESVSAFKGFYQSSDNKVIWTKSTDDEFEEISPRESELVSFTFQTKELGNATRLFKSPELTFNIRISGIRVNENNVEEEISTEIFKKIKFVSDVDYYREVLTSSGPFSNTGPIPPQAEQKTTYTVVWEVANTSNDLSNAKITARVPEYVQWNNLYSPENSDISFDSVKRTVTWDIGEIKAGVGHSSKRKSVSFQLTFTPSISQVGNTPSLLTDAIFNAMDTFTNTEISRISEVTSIESNDFHFNDITSSKVIR